MQLTPDPARLTTRMTTKRGGFSRVGTVAGRLLILLSALLLAFMPLTEHCWTFDRFLRGGQDLELGLLCLVALLCLALLLGRYAQQGLSLAMALREWLRHIVHKDHPAAIRGMAGCLVQRGHLCFPSPSLRLYTLPLLV